MLRRFALHPHIRATEDRSGLKGLLPGLAGVRVPAGFICSTVPDLLIAYRQLDVKDAVIKPLERLNGEDVLFVSSAQELKLYDFPRGQV